jgi:hypothetical protein
LTSPIPCVYFFFFDTFRFCCVSTAVEEVPGASGEFFAVASCKGVGVDVASVSQVVRNGSFDFRVTSHKSVTPELLQRLCSQMLEVEVWMVAENFNPNPPSAAELAKAAEASSEKEKKGKKKPSSSRRNKDSPREAPPPATTPISVYSAKVDLVSLLRGDTAIQGWYGMATKKAAPAVEGKEEGAEAALMESEREVYLSVEVSAPLVTEEEAANSCIISVHTHQL